MAKKSSVNVNDLSTWPLLIVIVVSAVIIAGCALAIKYFFVSDVTAKITTKNAEISKQEKLYEKNQEIIAVLPHLRKEVEALLEVREKAKQYLPTEVSMPSLINNVYLAARDSGIVFNTFNPSKDIQKKYYTIKPISLSADVGYLSMSAFIEKVTTLKRIMNVHSVSFKSQGGNNKNDDFLGFPDKPLSMTAELRTYIFKEKSTPKVKK